MKAKSMCAPNLPSLIYKGNGIEATTRPHSLNQVSLEQVDALCVAAVGPLAMGQLETELCAEPVAGMHEAGVVTVACFKSAFFALNVYDEDSKPSGAEDTD